MNEARILTPGAAGPGVSLGDDAFVDALVRVELGWLGARADLGLVSVAVLEAATVACAPPPSAYEISVAAEESGTPVLPVLSWLRERCDAPWHDGLTSQDVIDTALALLAGRAAALIDAELAAASDSLQGLAARYRDQPRIGRTLTQFAEPLTFGLTAAQWLLGIDEARAGVRRARRELRLQCGGPVGVGPRVPHADGDAVVAAFAGRVGLPAPGLPWQTRWTPLLRFGAACAEVCAAAGRIGSAVAALARSDVAEASVRHGGRSSAMPDKANPVLAVLLNAAALTAPGQLATLYVACGTGADERPAGAWHARWSPFRELLVQASTSARQIARLVADLEVNPSAMDRHLAGRPDVDVGRSGDYVDRALHEHATSTAAGEEPP